MQQSESAPDLLNTQMTDLSKNKHFELTMKRK